MKRILYVQYTNPSAYPPLENSSHILAERGWLVRFLGVKAAGDAQAIENHRHFNIEIQLAPRPERGGWGALQYLTFLARARRAIRALRPDVIYCSDMRSYPVGLWASRLPGVMTVLHEHDTPPPPTCGRAMRLLHHVRSRFARRATFCVLPQDERARLFSATTGAQRLRVVYNCPRKAEAEVRRNDRTSGDGLVLWYHGSIGPGQLPPAVVPALSRLPGDVKLEIAGYETVSTQGYVDSLRAAAREHGVEHRLRHLGPVPLRADLLRAAAKADIGLCLFATKFREPMVGASNKPFDYLACGLPLLTNKTPEWEGFFDGAGTSIGCDPDDPQEIARVVQRLRDAPEERNAMAQRGRDLIRSRWNYEAQFEKVIEELERGAKSRRRGIGDLARRPMTQRVRYSAEEPLERDGQGPLERQVCALGHAVERDQRVPFV